MSKRPWRMVRPRGAWLIIKADPRVKKTAGGIELPDQMLGVERVMEGTGHILRVGDHAEVIKTIGVDLEPGMRVVYRGFIKDVTLEYLDEEDGQVVFLLHAKDVLALVNEDTKMGAIS